MFPPETERKQMKNISILELFNTIFSSPDKCVNIYLKLAIDLIKYRQTHVLPIIHKNKRNCQLQEVLKHHIIPKCIFTLYNLPVDNSSKNLVRLTVVEHFKIHLWHAFYFRSILQQLPESEYKSLINHIMNGNIWAALRIIALKHMTILLLELLTNNEILAFRKMYSDCLSRCSSEFWKNAGEKERQHRSAYKKDWWKNLNTEKKNLLISKRLETISKLPKDYKDAYNKLIGQKNKEAWKKKSKEERQEFIEKCRILRKLEKMNKSPEQKKRESEILSKALKGEISVSNDITHHCAYVKSDVIEAFLLNGYTFGNHVHLWKANGYTIKINGIWYKPSEVNTF